MLGKIALKIAFLLLSLFVFYGGYENWKVREEQPTRTTVEDYVKSDKSKKWVVLTDAKINLLKGVFVRHKGTEEARTLYIPIQSAESTQNDTVSLLLKTSDKKILDVFDQLKAKAKSEAKSEAKSKAELLQFLLRESDKLILNIELSGVIVMKRGGNEEIWKHIENLASNFYILKHNSIVSLTAGSVLMGVGLLMFTMSLFSFYLGERKRQATEKAAHQAKMKEIIEAHKRKYMKDSQPSNLKAMSEANREKDKLMRSLEQNPYQISQGDLEQLKSKLEQLKPKGAEYAKFNLFSTNGRIGRMRYLVYSLSQLGIFVIIIAIISLTMNPGHDEKVIFVILAQINLAFSLILTVQRFHDSNTSGLFILLMWIPLTPLWLLFAPGTDGPNRYGLPSR